MALDIFLYIAFNDWFILVLHGSVHIACSLMILKNGYSPISSDIKKALPEVYFIIGLIVRQLVPRK